MPSLLAGIHTRSYFLKYAESALHDHPHIHCIKEIETNNQLIVECRTYNMSTVVQPV